MNKLMLVLVTLIFSMGFTVWAVDSPAAKVWVVSIGVGKYTRNFAALRTAADGARKIALAISDVNRDITTSYTLTTDAAEDINRPTKENVLQIFADLERQVQSNDRVIVYFCGHGVEFKDIQYLLLMNVTDIKNEELLATGSISVKWLREKLNVLKCKDRLLWLDACRVEALEATGDGDGTGDALPLTDTMITGSRLTSSGDGMAITYYGCRAGESVYYSKDGPSFFNKALIEGLHGKAADIRGRITMASLSRYVNGRVPVLVNEQNPALKQHPAMYPATIPDDALVLKSAPGAIACPSFSGQYGKPFAVTVFTRLSESGEVNLVERAQLNKALEELKLQESGLTDNAGAQKLGKLCNALYVLTGASEPVPGGRLQVSVRLVGVEDGKQLSGVAGECTVNPDDPDTWKPALQALAEDLLAAMRRNGITTRGGVSTAIPPKYQPPVTTQLTGSLRVTSEPAGATVYVGGNKIDGVTPLTVKGLRPGQYTILITRDGYGDVTQASIVKSNEEVVNTVTLPLLQGTIKVTSTPTGANVTIDGETRGVTTVAGLNIPGLSLGVHKVRISLPDYREETREITVVNGVNHPINISLIGLPGKVTISTSPKGARVQLDGVDYGKSLLTLTNITPGSHMVRVNLVGYASAAKEFVLSPNGTQMMTFDLTPLEKAQINVTSSPPGASIYINDKLQVEKTPAVFTLDEIGEEQQDVMVELRMQEYQSVIETFKIKAGDEKRNISFILQKGLAPTKINPKDGAMMILIPAGEFQMGSSDDDENYRDNEKPEHKVYIDAYYMYKTEVTVAQYRKFCESTDNEMPPEPDWGWQDTHPIVNVSWNDAKAYAEWAGAVLPTEAQWEKAARGEDGRIYPWGNEWDKNKCANWLNSGKGKTEQGTHPVGSFPTGASPYGLMDMSGNAWEWCADWYSDDYYENAPAKNPTGPETGDHRVLRGGSWDGGGDDFDNRSAYRSMYYDPYKIYYSFGFRCAYKIPLTPLFLDTPLSIANVPNTRINQKDGAEMILIPASDFLMGSTDADLYAEDDENPQHKVYLDTYYIYKTEVTVAQFRKFCHATGRKSMPPKPKWGWIDNHPIVNVTWNDAKAYADWAGVKLPTEAQWEKAARGGDGRIYPWGNTWDKTKCANETNSSNNNTMWKTQKVGSFPTGASPYGVMDMAGNVWEWCSDWYGDDYYKNAPPKNPTGPVTGDRRVLRGGSWVNNYYYRGALRSSNYPGSYYGIIGFRCVSPGPVKQLLPLDPPATTPVIPLPVDIPVTTQVTQLPKTKINPKDDAEMILIPAGDFLMGSTDADKYAQDNEKQQHKVYLDDYYMYKTEVTVAQYRKFCTATNRAMPDEPDWKWQDTHPIVNVSWNDAKAYADWAGASLPTEAHWEKAARGGDGRVYPWGNTWDEIKCVNYTNSGKGNTKYGTHPVGSFPTSVSPYGVMDMSGNVYEWCGDRYSTDYDKNAQVKTVTGDSRVLRGGSWRFDIRDDYDDDRGSYRCAYRYFDYSGSCYNYIGFRCAVALPGAMSQFLTDPPAITPVKTNINSKDGAEMTIGKSPVGVTDMPDNMAGSTDIGISDRGNVGVIAGGFSFGHDVGGKLMPGGNPSPGGRVNISDAPSNGGGGNGDGRVKSSSGSGGVSYLAEISGISNIGKVPSIIEKENLLGRVPGKSCTIIVDVQVGSSGQAMVVTLVKPTVFNVLNNNAIYISRKIEYRPGMKNGVVCPTTIPLKIKYIDGKDEPEIKKVE